MPENALLYLHAITSLHPGSGTALGIVDLPIQRERHTGWPVVPGSSIKGVLRDVCRRKNGDGPLLEAAFGPARIESGSDTAFAGALSVTDARILAFPVRSLKGVFAWVTCPQALRRWQRDAALTGVRVTLPQLTVTEGKALVPSGSALLAAGKIVLEEFVFDHVPASHSLFSVLPEEDRLRVVVLDDSDFTHFVRHATEVTARIKLDYKTKSVADKMLFYQEFLPAETLLYSVLLGTASRKPNGAATAEVMLRYLFQHLPDYLQIGGDETTGKGICRVVKGEA